MSIRLSGRQKKSKITTYIRTHKISRKLSQIRQDPSKSLVANLGKDLKKT